MCVDHLRFYALRERGAVAMLARNGVRHEPQNSLAAALLGVGWWRKVR